ncbi:MAG: hypothetical protein OEZ39_05560 [Gammaproteobacteria bacterium]|nr:hypothetical protein [Gammaproteobacteria bacterium]MDH5651322.1 hypothetical protein [Gammaproteobacteria bacterium]
MLERGSEWRRWDLHVHTPDTALEDGYGSWKEYVDVIAAQNAVKVIGVTDYFLFDNYSKLKEYRDNGYIPNIDLLIPNIEFRIAPPTEKATALNLHVIVSPEDPNHQQEIHNALARLTWEYDGKIYSCLRDQLISLGKVIDSSKTEDKGALAIGVTQFKIDFSGFRKWYQSEHWLKANSIIIAAAGDDGLSGFYTNGGWASWRDEITRFSRALFSGRPGERDFWLCRGSHEYKKTVMRLGGMKPCLHGSDAHCIDKLFKPDHDRFCWIKSDTTFEGLKQVLYEPETRVHIGPTAPIYHDESRVIRAIRLSKSDGWFDDVEIPLNAGLVSIIGQKGSGKSALAEITAFAAGSWATDEKGSFLRRAGGLLDGMQVELEWCDGKKTQTLLGGEQSDAIAVRYLSQKFVERLCSDDRLGQELVDEIENVIFSYIDESEKLNTSSFKELRALRTEGTLAQGQRLSDDIKRLIAEDCELRNKARALPEKKLRINKLAAERVGLIKQLPKASTPEEQKTQQELQDKRTALSVLQKAAGDDKQKLQKIKDIRAEITAFTARMNRFYTELEPALIDVGIPEQDRTRYKPAFPEDTEHPLSARESKIEATITTRLGAEDSPADGTIRGIEKAIEELGKKESADKARAKRIEDIQKRIAGIDTETERLHREIAQIEGPDRARIETIAAERMDTYRDYFENLKIEHRTLAELYSPITARIQSDMSLAQEQALEFSIRWEVDLDTWMTRGERLFDQRRIIPYGTMADLKKAAQDKLVPAWASGDPGKIKPAMDDFLTEFRNKDLPPAQYMRTGITVQDVFDWLYETEHIQLNYGLKYNGTELEKLSPGTKGIVLLILYLGMDVSDSRPLIVDQPDENLDNESIYQLLTGYFKTAKSRRQIILITHNPNLVVNGDSEQVIIATCARRDSGLPYITYEAGALEEPHIRAQVCRILEGGTTAFRKREQRYALKHGVEII